MGEKTQTNKGAVLVIGAGIGGIQSALDLRDLGYKSYLVENNSEMMGNIVDNCCRATDNCNECSICFAREKVFEVLSYPEIEILRNTNVKEVNGKPGNFNVVLEQQEEQNQIDCPVCDGFPPYSSAPSNKKRDINLDVGAIIISTGFEPFDSKKKIEYGYGIYKNVITAMDLESMIREQNKIVFDPEKKQPKNIAVIQCVGSRDKQVDTNYCSSVCCTYGIKNTNRISDQLPDANLSVFFMDMRTYQKGAESHYNKASENSKIKFIRSRIASIEDIEKDNKLVIKYESDDGQLHEDIFDLVVLNVGLKPSKDIVKLSRIFNIKLNKYGFFISEELKPTHSEHEGIFIVGTASGPKDINETVTESSCAAAEVAELLNNKKKLDSINEYHIEPESVEPRLGVFICNCGTEISDTIDIKKLMNYAKTLPHVVYAEENKHACSRETRQQMMDTIKKNKINRVLIAACSHKTHEALFQKTLNNAGLNPYVLEMANILDQCSWIHSKEPEKATHKAMDIIRIAATKTELLKPLPQVPQDIIQTGLVIGGGLTGMISALSIADQGHEVFLIEKEKELGGNLRHIYYTLENKNIQDYLNSIINKIEKNPKIKIYKNAKVEEIKGSLGDFTTTINSDSKKTELKHGIIIIATGAEELKPEEYLYDVDKRVIRQQDLEKQIIEGKNFKKSTIVIIQCVGSRDDEHPYCSRVCCNDAIKNALKLKEKDPETEIFILYRDIRSCGFQEAFYDAAREKGVIFIRYDVDKKPQINKGKDLQVKVRDPILNADLLINADFVVLSPAIIPGKENSILSEQLDVPLNENGFYQEAHMRLRPVDTSNKGVFIAGMANSPKSISESISQAYAAASRACAILSHDVLYRNPKISFVVDKNCDGCAYCVDPCPYNAITLLEYIRDGQIKKTVEVNEAVCEGCGICMATCPKQGVFTKGYTYNQIMAQGKSAVEHPEEIPSDSEFEPRLVVFRCNSSTFTGSNKTETEKYEYPTNVRIIKVQCTGTIHPNFVIETLTSGADGVLICGCHPGGCHYIEGNLKAEKRAEAIDLLLEDFGLEPERFNLKWVSSNEGQKFAEIVKDMVEQLKEIGPSPYST